MTQWVTKDPSFLRTDSEDSDKTYSHIVVFSSVAAHEGPD